jgi:hypothetical protein
MGNETLVEVDLSHVQFAELITTMNQGTGVPCTIRKLPGDWDIPEIAHHETEQKRVSVDFDARLNELVEKARTGMSEIEAVLAKPSIGKADRESIRNHFYKWVRMIEDSAPFVLNQFQESIEKTTAAAKAEVDGFLTSVIASTGLAALREKFGVPELPSGKNREDQ